MAIAQTRLVLTSSWFLFALVTMATREIEYLSSQYFLADVLCHVEDRLMMGCSKQLPSMRSQMECIFQCNVDSACMGASLDINGVCYNHFSCPLVNNTCVKNEDHVYISRMCANGGAFDPVSRTCQCVNAWVGPHCQIRPADCLDLIVNGYPSGTYDTYLDPYQNGSLFQVFCTIVSKIGYFGINIAYHDGSIDFNLTMQNYEHRFYIDDQNFWIGLKTWHAISFLGYNTLFITVDFGDEGMLYRSYNDFFLFDASKKYSFFHGKTLENGRGNVLLTGNRLSDCFGPLQHAEFYTWDKDNQESCASKAGSGWWYTSCNNACNLFNYGPGYEGNRSENQLLLVPGVNTNYLFSNLQHITLFVQKD